MKTQFTLIFLLISTLSFSQEVEKKEEGHPIDKELRECSDKEENQGRLQRLDCIANASKAWDKEMNKYYNLLMKTLKKADQDNLRAAQKKWIEYRDKEFEFSSTNYVNREGTVWAEIDARRHCQIIKQRALDLMDYYEWVQGE